MTVSLTADELTRLDDADLLEHAYNLVAETVERLDDQIAGDDLYNTLGEIFERISPIAALEEARRSLPGTERDVDAELRDICAGIAHRAWRRLPRRR